jgi:hypothetical protein
MNNNEKINQKDMKEIIKKINSSICFIDEKFKQLYIDEEYIPYIISSTGRIFSINYMHQKGNVHELKSRTDKDGYKLILIHYNHKNYGYHIHRLVALTFIPIPIKYRKQGYSSNDLQVNHKDGNKSINCDWNLEWLTCKENIHHAWKNNLAHSIGIYNGNSVYSNEDIETVCKLLESDYSIKQISKKINVPYYIISLVLNKKNWLHISNNYDFSNYSYGKKKRKDVINVCKLLEKGEYSIKEISKICNVKTSFVSDISSGKTFKSISKDFNINISCNK